MNENRGKTVGVLIKNEMYAFKNLKNGFEAERYEIRDLELAMVALVTFEYLIKERKARISALY